VRIATAITSASLLLITLPAAALEVDCAACDFCAGQGDLADVLDARIRQHIAAGMTVQQIAEFEGGGSVVRPRIEVWADHLPEAVQPDRRRFKYRGAGLPDSAALSAYAPSVKVNGICLGTDKLACSTRLGDIWIAEGVLQDPPKPKWPKPLGMMPRVVAAK